MSPTRKITNNLTIPTPNDRVLDVIFFGQNRMNAPGQLGLAGPQWEQASRGRRRFCRFRALAGAASAVTAMAAPRTIHDFAQASARALSMPVPGVGRSRSGEACAAIACA